ncbi:MAG: hypothetical protein KatS3mg105_2616 [Gemmatales bacterium]|nr:MAG: hypothetical protein KatS3mg105_2616 [Gemmatales bacterium]
MQLSRGATGLVANNTISTHHFTPGTFASTSVLLFQAGPGVEVADKTELSDADVSIFIQQTPDSIVTGNKIFNNDFGLFNFISDSTEVFRNDFRNNDFALYNLTSGISFSTIDANEFGNNHIHLILDKSEAKLIDNVMAGGDTGVFATGSRAMIENLMLFDAKNGIILQDGASLVLNNSFVAAADVGLSLVRQSRRYNWDASRSRRKSDHWKD